MLVTPLIFPDVSPEYISTQLETDTPIITRAMIKCPAMAFFYYFRIFSVYKKQINNTHCSSSYSEHGSGCTIYCTY